MLIILTVLFFAESSRGMVMPSLNLYVDSLTTEKRWFGILIGSYSVGRLIGSTVLGYLYNKFGIQWTLQFALILSLGGNALYVFAALFNSIWVLLLARLLTGFSTGTLSIVRAFVAERTTKEERTRWVSYSTAVQYIGFALVPGFGAFFAHIDFTVGVLPVNQYTTPGFVLFFANAVMVPAVYFFIPNHKNKEEEVKGVAGIKGGELRLFYWGLALFIGLNLVGRGVLSVLETTVSRTFEDILEDVSDPGQEPNFTRDTSIMLFALGMIGLVIFFLLDPLTKRVKEEIILNVGFVIIAGGSVALISYGRDPITFAQFAIGSISILSIASPVVQTLVVSTFSKILGSKPQGTMMGYITSAGSVGRILMPPITEAVGSDAAYGLSGKGSGPVDCIDSEFLFLFFFLFVCRKKFKSSDFLIQGEGSESQKEILSHLDEPSLSECTIGLHQKEQGDLQGGTPDHSRRRRIDQISSDKQLVVPVNHFLLSTQTNKPTTASQPQQPWNILTRIFIDTQSQLPRLATDCDKINTRIFHLGTTTPHKCTREDKNVSPATSNDQVKRQ
ncbi:Major Facilitator Superfamily (MFS) [Planoprotostelium fungivorum]|uniref:Major Facilitator Superfamily (MFS) n=1 Tax=Planoprotostelium fungivorum TaxID=1890364 RepID=A0A2P6NYP2_9EUKA|nr:Major Facilitator Superfamily (MFS) [Planoprotostelium fungivorum]